MTSDLSWGSKTLCVDGNVVVIAAKNRLASRLRLWNKYNSEEDKKGTNEMNRVCRATFYRIANSITSRDLKSRGSCDPNVTELGDENFDSLRKFVTKFVNANEISKNITDVQRFIKFDYNQHIIQSLEKPNEQSSLCCTHCPSFALGDQNEDIADCDDDHPCGSKSAANKGVKQTNKRQIITKK